MNILSIDTCNGYCALGISSNGHFFDLVNKQPNMQSFSLTQMIDEILALAGVKITDLNKIIFTNGPGSFTGIRVGLAFALGLKIANIAKLITIDNLSAYYLHFSAENPDHKEGILVANKAMRDNFYYQSFFDNGTSSLMLGNIQEISKVFAKNLKVTGNSPELKSQISDYIYYENIKMSNLIKFYLADDAQYKKLFDESGEIKPLYLRDAL